MPLRGRTREVQEIDEPEVEAVPAEPAEGRVEAHQVVGLGAEDETLDRVRALEQPGQDGAYRFVDAGTEYPVREGGVNTLDRRESQRKRPGGLDQLGRDVGTDITDGVLRRRRKAGAVDGAKLLERRHARCSRIASSTTAGWSMWTK